MNVFANQRYTEFVYFIRLASFLKHILKATFTDTADLILMGVDRANTTVI